MVCSTSSTSLPSRTRSRQAADRRSPRNPPGHRAGCTLRAADPAKRSTHMPLTQSRGFRGRAPVAAFLPCASSGRSPQRTRPGTARRRSEDPAIARQRYVFVTKAYLNAPALAVASTAAGRASAPSRPPWRTRGRPMSPAAALPRSAPPRGSRLGPRTAGTAAGAPAGPASAAWTGRRSRGSSPAARLDDPERCVGRLAAAGARLRLPLGRLALDLEDKPRRAVAPAVRARAALLDLPLQGPHPARDGSPVAHAASPTITSGCGVEVIRSQMVRWMWTSRTAPQPGHGSGGSSRSGTPLVRHPRPPPHRLHDRHRSDVVQVADGRGNRGVAELLGNDPDIHPLGAQLGGVGVAEAVGVDPLGDPRLGSELAHQPPDVGPPQFAAGAVAEQRGLRLRRPPRSTPPTRPVRPAIGPGGPAPPRPARPFGRGRPCRTGRGRRRTRGPRPWAAAPEPR
jgi:hypothetical protein